MNIESIYKGISSLQYKCWHISSMQQKKSVQICDLSIQGSRNIFLLVQTLCYSGQEVHWNVFELTLHTDPLCQIFSKNCFNGKIASKQLKFEWFWTIKTSEGQENWKKAKNFFEGQTKARGGKIQIFIIFSTFYD